MNLAIVIPAFNEEKTIKNVCEYCKPYGDVIVFDDNSTDKTAIIAAKQGVKVFESKSNLGYEKNLYRGIKKSMEMGYRYCITIDADGQHRIQDLLEVKNKLIQGFDLVIGRRDFIQRDSEKIICELSNKIFGIADILCGLKGYNLKMISRFNFSHTLDTIATSLAIHQKRNGYSHIDIPIKIENRMNGTSSFGGNDIESNYRLIVTFLNNFLLENEV